MLPTLLCLVAAGLADAMRVGARYRAHVPAVGRAQLPVACRARATRAHPLALIGAGEPMSAAAPQPRRARPPRALRPLLALLRALRGVATTVWWRLCYQIAKGVEGYRRSSRPQSIFLLRHGQSRGNVNESLYSVIADHAMELTDLGHEQARVAGRFLRELIGDAPVHCFQSPYRRASQTLARVVESFPEDRIAVREDPLLREQEFGNWQDVELIKKAKAERRSYGRFWYRFANGESGADVHNRAADFLSTLFRQMDLSSRVERHYVIIAHGLFVRLLCMRYLGWTVKQFEQVWNPANCEIWQLERQSDGRYYLAKAYRPEQSADGKLEMVESPLHYGPDRGFTIPEGMRRPRSYSSDLVLPDVC